MRFSSRRNAHYRENSTFCHFSRNRKKKPIQYKYKYNTAINHSSMSNSNELSSIYKFCPIGGIVCSLCRYPVKITEGLVKGIYKHEKDSNNHSVLLDHDKRVTIVLQFEEYMNDLAKCVVNALPNETAAKQIVLDQINQTSQQYPYCSICDKLVMCKYMHNSKKHSSSCKDSFYGYISKIWTKKEPKVLSTDFSLDNKNIFCPTLHDSINTELLQQRKSVARDAANQDTRLQAFRQMTAEQDQFFNDNENGTILHQNNFEKNPDLWLERTGWDDYFNGFQACHIYNVTAQFKTDSEQLEIKLEQSLVEAVQEKTKYVRRLSRLHLILYEIQRRPYTIYPRRPFRLPTEKSVDRYINTIRTIFRVIVRIYNYQSTTIVEAGDFNDSSLKYPYMNFTKAQKTAIRSVISAPDIKENYITLLLSLASQKYKDHPYQCTLVCAMAYLSLKDDSTYKSATDYTNIYSSILCIYKVIVLHKSIENLPPSALKTIKKHPKQHHQLC
jgi:hypothetical protein